MRESEATEPRVAGKIDQRALARRKHHLHLLDFLDDIMHNRNLESEEHVACICAYTRILAEAYADRYPEAGLTEEKIDMLVRAARVHDIGKIAVTDVVLLKPGRMSAIEMKLLEEHTIKGAELIQIILEFEQEEFQTICYNVCRYHHEKYDGTGYPDGLSGEQIPLEAQLVGVADMYDVLVHFTVNKEPYSADEAYYALKDGKCGAISEKMQECLTLAQTRLAQVEIGND